MRKDKSSAIKLRKKGLSYNQISSQLNIPISTLSYWLRNIKLNKEAEKILNTRKNKGSEYLIIRNKDQSRIAKIRAEKIKNEAIAETKKYINEKLFIAGVSLYWAEGYKKGAYGSKWKCIDFANSDPEMLKIIIKFYKKYLQVKNCEIKIQIIAHQNININNSIKYWSTVLGIDIDQFIKHSLAKKNQTPKRTNKNLKHGTIHLRVYSVDKFHRLIGWIEGFKKLI